jgi:hypothetical protein
MCPMNPRLLRPLATGFNPRRISGLLAWWDAQTPSSYDIATGVSEWRDLSGNANHLTQSITNNQPTLSTLNGRTAFSFDGSNDQLAAASSIITASSAGQFSAFAVVQTSDNSGNMFSAGAVNNGFNFLAATNDFRLLFGMNAGTPTAVTISRTANTPDVFGVTYAAGTAQLGINGTLNSAVSVTNTVNASSNVFVVGNRSGQTAAAELYAGLIGSIVIYNRALSLAERSRVERWLGSRWGIAVA